MNEKREAGFTLIELLIVAVIVGILATVVAMTHSGVRASDRNNARQDNIKVLQGQLEAFYAQNSQYPTFANLNDAAWRSENLKDLPQSILRDPQWSNKVKDCTAADQATLAATPTNKCYSYQVTTADGSVCDNDAAPCAQYTLTASLEGGDKYVKSSLN
jgi:prepilin-type N-terminal cleavage/methylation domain-containing protein